MSRINTASLIMQATGVASRANYVRQDPPVVKAAKEALGDIAQAGRSTTNLVREAQFSWERSSDRLGSGTSN